MPTRREFLWGSAAAAGAMALAGSPFQLAEAAPGADFVAWHNKTLQEHIQLRDQHARQGYRFRSVSLYGGGTANNSYFAAVMVRRPKVVAQRDWRSELASHPLKPKAGLSGAPGREKVGHPPLG